jgi:hypothetical protein
VRSDSFHMQDQGPGALRGVFYPPALQSSTVSKTDLGCTLLSCSLQENFDKREKKTQITFPLRHVFPLKVVK